MKRIPLKNISIANDDLVNHATCPLLSVTDCFSVTQHLFDGGKGHYKTAVHCHDCYELEILLSGSAENFMNNDVVSQSVNDFWLLGPDDVHSLHCTSEEPVTILTVHFTEKALFDTALLELYSLTDPIHGSLSSEYIEYIAKSLETLSGIKIDFADISKYAEVLKTFINGVLLYVIRLGTRRKRTEPQKLPHSENTDAVFRNAVKYVRTHYKEKLLECDIAAMFGYSPAYFSECFRQYTGKTFTVYRQDLRLNYAYNRLVMSSESIEIIFSDSGFGSKPYFYKCFCERYGKKPLEIRNTAKKRRIDDLNA